MKTIPDDAKFDNEDLNALYHGASLLSELPATDRSFGRESFISDHDHELFNLIDISTVPWMTSQVEVSEEEVDALVEEWRPLSRQDKS